MKTAMRSIGASLLAVVMIVALVVAMTPLAEAQGSVANRVPIIITKYPMTGVAKTGTGNFWSTAQPSLNYTSAIVHWVTTGSPGGCAMSIKTGPTAALATLSADDANAAITCTTSGEKVVNSLNSYFNINLGTLSGGSSPSVTVYVTLTNGVGWTQNNTLSAVTQGAAAANHSSPWWARQSDGTNDMPMMDAVGRPGFQKITDGTNTMPTGDALARSIFVKPGNGTTTHKDLSEGVGALGVGVQQVGELNTLSAMASNTITEVVAAPGAGSTVLRALLVEKVSGASATVTLSYGTGSNCGTGTTVLAGPITLSASSPRINLGVVVPATKALCITTDAAGTGVRALTN